MQKLIAILALICLVNLASCKYECKIPKWPDYYQNTYTTKCGYLGDPIIKYNYHYIYVNRSLTILNPLIIKIGGGNGESSMVGLFSEFGPYLWNEDGNFDQTENYYTWAQKAHLLFIDAPYKTGFNYLLDKSDVGVYTDDQTATKVAAAIQTFLNDNEYKALKKSRIYLQGQDAAGMFLPKVADILIRQYGTTVQGLMLGNPILSVADNCDPESDRVPESTMTYFANREYLSPQLNRIWTSQQACQRSEWAAPRCRYLINRLGSILEGINLYNINADCKSDMIGKKVKSSSLKHEFKSHCLPVCRKETGKNQYLNDPTTIKNMNAADPVTANRTYNIFDEETFDLYGEHSAGKEQVLDVLARLIKNNTKVVLYSGLNDGDIPHLLVEQYVHTLEDKLDAYSMGMKQFNCTSLSKEQQVPPVGGWSEKFSFGAGGFIYLRVRAAGRWVPADFPEAGYEIFSRTVSETDPW